MGCWLVIWLDPARDVISCFSQSRCWVSEETAVRRSPEAQRSRGQFKDNQRGPLPCSHFPIFPGCANQWECTEKGHSSLIWRNSMPRVVYTLACLLMGERSTCPESQGFPGFLLRTHMLLMISLQMPQFQPDKKLCPFSHGKCLSNRGGELHLWL